MTRARRAPRRAPGLAERRDRYAAELRRPPRRQRPTLGSAGVPDGHARAETDQSRSSYPSSFNRRLNDRRTGGASHRPWTALAVVDLDGFVGREHKDLAVADVSFRPGAGGG